MVKRYYGGVISATQAVANASSATGFFNVTQQMQAVQAGEWPLQPPPPSNTAAWFGGGYALHPSGNYYWSVSTVQRITFATDTATASVRGPLSAGTTQLGAAGNTTDGWFGGGRRINVPSPTGSRSTVDRITYATDTATASVRGPLSSARGKLGAAGNETDGWFGGGYVAYYNPSQSTVNRITYSTDTATTSVRGTLSVSSYDIAAAGNSTDAWFAGGKNPGADPISTVSRITYATDTATASVRGPLNATRYGLGAAGNTTNGWFGGGMNYSTVSRITYATDTATTSTRGPLSVQAVRLAAAGGIQ